MNPLLQKVIIRADKLYSRRAEIDNVRVSVELLKRAKAQATNYEIDWRLGRAFFFLGQQAALANATRSIETARLLHAEGIAASRRAAAEKGERVEGHFWLGVNEALAAEGAGSLSAIRLVLTARRALKRSVEIDESYHAAGPLRVLGRLEHKVPRWLGGGKRLALASYQKALVIAPENTVTRIYYAELLLDMGKRECARSQLEFVLHTQEDPDWAFEIGRDKCRAIEMLKARC